MFKCYFCENTTKPRERAEKVVLESRPKKYGVPSSRNKHQEAQGYENVKEVYSCKECFDKRGSK